MAKLLTGTRIYGTGTVDTQLFVNGTTTASSTTTGALQVVGGVGIGGNLYVGRGATPTLFTDLLGNVAIGTTTPTANLHINASINDGVKLRIQNTNTGTGAFVQLNTQVGSNALYNYAFGENYTTAGRYIQAAGVIDVTGAGGLVLSAGSSSSTANISFWTSGNNERVRISSTGLVNIFSTVNASSTAAAALVVAGGVGIGQDLRVGGVIYGAFNGSITGTATTATNIAGGTLGQVPFQTAPGVTSFYGPGTAGNVLVSNGAAAPSYNNTLTLASTLASISTTTGALQVWGGVGIGGSVNIGSGNNTITTPTWEKFKLVTTGVAAAARQGSDVNGLNFTSNALWSGTWSEDDATRKKFAYIQHLGNSRHEFRSAATGTGVSWITGLTLDDNAGTFNVPLTITATPASISTDTGALIVTGGVGIGRSLFVQENIVQVGGTYSTLAATYNLINTTATTVNFAGAATALNLGATTGSTNIRNNLSVAGNLTVQGTTTIVDSTVTNIADPIITLGGGAGNTAPVADDNKDRGIAFKWVNNGGTTSTGFFGYDDSTGYLTYIQTATITNEVVSGTKGAADVNLAGGSAMSLVYQSAANTTEFLAAGSSGFILQTNGTGSAPTWVSSAGIGAGSATNSDAIRTIERTTAAAHFLTFVDSNNATNAYESLYTTSSFTINPQSGNVGIGTNSPTGKLTVSGTIHNNAGGVQFPREFRNDFTPNSERSDLFFLSNFTSDNGFRIGTLASSGGTTLQSTKGTDSSVKTNIVINPDGGNVSIGTFTTSIAKKFTVVGEGNFSDASNTIRLYMGFGTIPTTGGAGAYIYNSDNSPIAFGTTNTERMRIDAAGNVGIGTASPAYRVTVTTSTNSTTTTASSIALHLFNPASDGNISQPNRIGIGFGASSTRSAIVAGTFGNDYLDFYTNGDITTPRIRIRSTGAIAFSGTNTHGTAGQILQSNGDAPPTWVPVSGTTVGTSTQVSTVLRTTDATHFLTFVDSNNATATAESVYTTSTFSINPSTGFVNYSTGGIVVGDTTNAITLQSDYSFPLIVQRSGNSGKGAIVMRGSDTIGTAIEHGRSNVALHWGTYQAFLVHDDNTSDALLSLKEKMRINATGVGIGTTAPATRLDVAGTIGFTVGSAAGIIRRTTVNGSNGIRIQGNASDTITTDAAAGAYITVGGGVIGDTFEGNIDIVAYGGNVDANRNQIRFSNRSGVNTITERMRIDKDGNVGIGTAAPGARLDIQANDGGDTRSIQTVLPPNTSYNPPADNTPGKVVSGIRFNWYSDNWQIGAARGGGVGVDGFIISRNNTSTVAITANGAIAFGLPTNFGSAGQVLQSNGNAAPTWIALSNSTVGTSTQVTTVARTTNASHFLTFVDSNNASSSAELLYTSGTIVINPGLGYVGIGQNNPQTLLHLSGTNQSIFLDNMGLESNGLRLRYQTNSAHGANFLYNPNSAVAFIENTYATVSGQVYGDIYFTQNVAGTQTTRMTIKADGGNVGIGTTTPTARLHVAGAINAYAPINSTINFSNSDSDNATYTNRNDRVLTSNGASWAADGRDPILTLTRSNSGLTRGQSIGLLLHNENQTTNSYSPLVGFSAQSNSGSFNSMYAAIMGKKTGQNLGVDPNWNRGELHFYANGNVYMNDTPTMVIHGTGVAVGTTSTLNSFEVAGTAGQLFSVSDSFTGTIFSANDVSGIPSIEVIDTGLVKLAQYNGQVGISTGTVASGSALTVYGMISTLGPAGEIRASNEITAYFSSDRRLKENIKLIENPITIIDQIRGVTFDWTDEHMARRGGEDGYFVRKHDIGVIAQEVQAVLPELVGTRPDGYLAVKYEKLVPLLIEAIKSQQKTIDSLVKDLNEVKEFIDQIKNKNGI